ncbi:GNAT family N-acetyltransferase [Rheinheimera maricola]|uniref:GNAT family N-acetyltransferase n=1 Tax=Rheinheimera maricola TaxID=2793282 RepID=A0ABS7X7Y9_9GAMM|nr:GNAT family N-acetyltransferase [Rheinheimera maricola]MBZ9610727.1 GNAT family N-acetyltransferase [Rheinheimera maricola]
MSGIKQFGVLSGERVKLRPVNEADYPLYASLYGDDNILRYICSALDQPSLEKSFVSAVKQTQQTPCKRAFLVAELSDNTAVGILGLTFDEDAKKIEVGVIFKLDYQRNHLAFSALQMLITYLKREFSSYGIFAKVAAENRPAVKLARKLGFQFDAENGFFELY